MTIRSEDLRSRLRLLLITDDAGRSAGQLRAIITEALRGGVTAVQLREKRATARQLQTLVRKLAPVCRAAGAPLLLNGALLARLAPPLDVDGLHYNIRSLLAETIGADPSSEEEFVEMVTRFDFPEAAREALGRTPDDPPPLTGYSAHSVSEALRALRQRADYLILSPIYDTPSKIGIMPSCGPGPLSVLRAQAPGACLIGLGGIDPSNATEVIRSGADGVAVIRAIMSSTDPRTAAQALRQAVEDGVER